MTDSVVGVLGIVFPLILALGGYFYAGLCLPGSMSAYYHATGPSGRTMHNWFGILFCSPVFSCIITRALAAAKTIELNIAGVLWIGIAMFPMDWSPCQLIACVPRKNSCPAGGLEEWIGLHRFRAIKFFRCIASVGLFCVDDTLPLIQSNKVRE